MAEHEQLLLESVPVIDLKDEDRTNLVALVDSALRRYGFFYVTNHGVPLELVAEQFRVSRALFDLSLDDKRSMPFDEMLDIGYMGPATSDAGQAVGVVQGQRTPDTKEGFMMTNNILITDPNATIDNEDDIFHGSTNYTVHQVPDHAKVASDYMAATYRLNRKLNSILFEALGLENTDDNNMLCRALGDQPFCVLKQMRYAGEISDPTQAKFGAGAHTDWGSFTILATDHTPGLQVYVEDTKQWLPIPPKSGCLIINAGDQIGILTNHYYKSALHRVLTTSTKPRYSTAVFTYFGMHTTVGPLDKYVALQGGKVMEKSNSTVPMDPRTTLEYFHYKLHQSMEPDKPVEGAVPVEEAMDLSTSSNSAKPTVSTRSGTVIAVAD